MLDLTSTPVRLCDRLSRREMLRLGGLAPLGLSLPALLAAQQAQGANVHGHFGRAKRCLLLFMWGGPAHQDTFDLKPDAADGVRSEFKPIDTRAPGIQLCEHFQHLAQHTDKLSIIRSVTHSDNNHSTAAHWMLTGHKHRLAAENFNASESDHPHLGSIVSRLKPAASGLPTFVALPERIGTTIGAVAPGQFGGMIGKRYDPFPIDDKPDKPDFAISSLKLPAEIDSLRVSARKDLLATIEAARRDLEQSRDVSAMSTYHQQALDLIVSPATRRAFDLRSEPAAVRDRYGHKTFGQGALLARRLLEAGVKLVTVYWHRDMPGVDTTWDTHGQNFKQLKERLIPQVDQPISTLLTELQERGMLDDTLVVWFSEFGRTPRVNKGAGRDHWGACNSVWLAGAGLPGGRHYGTSDAQAAYPATNPVRPSDLAATIFHMLGISPEAIVQDIQGRPFKVADGDVISGLFS
jgi:hypothetical protein